MKDMMTMKRFVPACIVACIMYVLTLSPAQALVEIDITSGHADPLPVALMPFEGQYGDQIVEVIENNLRRTGLFAPIEARKFIQRQSVNFVPRFADWRLIEAQALVHGKTIKQDDGRLKVEFRLWDVYAETQLEGLAYFTDTNNWRRVAHIISDAIYHRLTGEEGYFDSRIVYVAESGRADVRRKRLAIMDQDGKNHKYLTDGNDMVLTPRFSPNSQKITYMAYYSNKPRVYVLDLDTGVEEVLGDFPGMTFAPRFTPDGGGVIMSLADNGNTDIYTLNLESKRLKRLTRNPAIDTSPSYAPDGKKVVFASDRGGTQQLYVMDAGGKRAKRISFGKGRYGTPVWSPRGDLIAFTRQYGGRFYIGVMKPDGSGERLLSESYLDEGPTWSPNGRVIAFFRQGAIQGGTAKTRIYTVDVTGTNLQEMQTPEDASDPAWSPLLP